MDLTEAKRLMGVKDECANDRIDIRNAIQRNLANQVPALVTEVERLEARAKYAEVALGVYEKALELIRAGDAKAYRDAVAWGRDDGWFRLKLPQKLAKKALDGPGPCCVGYATHGDAHSVGCLWEGVGIPPAFNTNESPKEPKKS